MNQAKIGKFLAELRKENGMTQEQLAEKLNVARRTISRWETGCKDPENDFGYAQSFHCLQYVRCSLRGYGLPL